MALSKTDARAHGRHVREAKNDHEKQATETAIVETLKTSLDWGSIGSVHIYQAIQANRELDMSGFTSWLEEHQPETEVYLQPQEPDYPTEQYDVVIAPCLAIDEIGNRVGYGGGGYDSFMATQDSAKFIVVCYESQMVPRIAPEEHDVPASMIITEKHTRRFS